MVELYIIALLTCLDLFVRAKVQKSLHNCNFCGIFFDIKQSGQPVSNYTIAFSCSPVLLLSLAVKTCLRSTDNQKRPFTSVAHPGSNAINSFYYH